MYVSFSSQIPFFYFESCPWKLREAEKLLWSFTYLRKKSKVQNKIKIKMHFRNRLKSDPHLHVIVEGPHPSPLIRSKWPDMSITKFHFIFGGIFKCLFERNLCIRNLCCKRELNFYQMNHSLKAAGREW